MAPHTRAQEPKPESAVPPPTSGRGGRRLSGKAPGGGRLAAAFAAVGSLPALEDSRANLGALTRREPASDEKIIAAVETDPALTIAVVRAAGNTAEPDVGSVPQAVGCLGSSGVGEAVEGLDTYRLFESAAGWEETPHEFRRHSLATRNAAERVGELTDAQRRDEIALAALLHDVGRLALHRLYPAYPELISDQELTPEGRVDRERLELGVDHALIGGVLLRRWGLSQEVAAAVEGHHDPTADGSAAVVRLADHIANHGSGGRIGTSDAEQAAASCGIEGQNLRKLLAEDPYRPTARRRSTKPSPLSKRELSALRGLAEGKVYKQIAAELGLSASTIRSHLHNAYGKLGVADRAQAVILAREHGWI